MAVAVPKGRRFYGRPGLAVLLAAAGACGGGGGVDHTRTALVDCLMRRVMGLKTVPVQAPAHAAALRRVPRAARARARDVVVLDALDPGFGDAVGNRVVAPPPTVLLLGPGDRARVVFGREPTERQAAGADSCL